MGNHNTFSDDDLWTSNNKTFEHNPTQNAGQALSGIHNVLAFNNSSSRDSMITGSISLPSISELDPQLAFSQSLDNNFDSPLSNIDQTSRVKRTLRCGSQNLYSSFVSSSTNGAQISRSETLPSLQQGSLAKDAYDSDQASGFASHASHFSSQSNSDARNLITAYPVVSNHNDIMSPAFSSVSNSSVDPHHYSMATTSQQEPTHSSPSNSLATSHSQQSSSSTREGNNQNNCTSKFPVYNTDRSDSGSKKMRVEFKLDSTGFRTHDYLSTFCLYEFNQPKVQKLFISNPRTNTNHHSDGIIKYATPGRATFQHIMSDKVFPFFKSYSQFSSPDQTGLVRIKNVSIASGSHLAYV